MRTGTEGKFEEPFFYLLWDILLPALFIMCAVVFVLILAR